jgi:hypothetical protein
MAVTEVSASEVSVGDKIVFQSSRTPKEVESVVMSDDSTVTLVSDSGQTRWKVPADFTVKKEEA